MKKYLLGLVLLGLTSIGYADYNWASWYNLNPTISGNLTVGGTLGVTGLSTLGSLSVTGNATSGQTLTTKHLVVTSSANIVGDQVWGSGASTSTYTAATATLNLGGSSFVGGGDTAVFAIKTNKAADTMYLRNAADTGTTIVRGQGVFTVASSMTVNGYYQYGSKTIAQVKAYTPTAIGQAFFVTDSVPPSIYISTGTSALMWGKISLGSID